jgi:hypothetical protein
LIRLLNERVANAGAIRTVGLGAGPNKTRMSGKSDGEVEVAGGIGFRFVHVELAQLRTLPLGAMITSGGPVVGDCVRIFMLFCHDNAPQLRELTKRSISQGGTQEKPPWHPRSRVIVPARSDDYSHCILECRRYQI